jgi:polar amino acid transport system substrate-binding protein
LDRAPVPTLGRFITVIRSADMSPFRTFVRWSGVAIVASTLLVAGAARADALDDITKAGVLKVAVPSDFPPFGSVDSDMKPIGLDIEIAALIAEKLSLKLELVPVASANRIPYLQTRKADLVISTLGKSPEREKVIAFSQPYAPYNNSVFGPASISAKGASDLKGKTVGVTRGTFEDIQITDSAPGGTDIRRFEDNNATISAYLSGQVQLVGTGDFVAFAIASRNPPSKPELKYVLHESACYVGMNLNEPRLMAKVNAAMSGAKHSGEINKIVLKWLKTPLPEKLIAQQS